MVTASYGAITYRYGPGPCSVLEPELARQRIARGGDECALRRPGCAGFAELIDGDRKPCERVGDAAIAKSADDPPWTRALAPPRDRSCERADCEILKAQVRSRSRPRAQGGTHRRARRGRAAARGRRQSSDTGRAEPNPDASSVAEGVVGWRRRSRESDRAAAVGWMLKSGWKGIRTLSTPRGTSSASRLG